MRKSTTTWRPSINPTAARRKPRRNIKRPWRAIRPWTMHAPASRSLTWVKINFPGTQKPAKTGGLFLFPIVHDAMNRLVQLGETDWLDQVITEPRLAAFSHVLIHPIAAHGDSADAVSALDLLH